MPLLQLISGSLLRNPTRWIRETILLAVLAGWAEPWANAAGPFALPTANDAIFQGGGDERFFVGTVGKSWVSGAFGCVRTDGWQFHEGLDIRCLQRDQRGEPADPVLATAAGTVAYLNRRASLSNYGQYAILRHVVDGIEVYSVYSHLSGIRADLKPGAPVQCGEQIGIMGRTANTREPISKDRAHLHFELNLLLNDRFAEWHRTYRKGQRNDHGDWNGRNLVGIDPRDVLWASHYHSNRFSLRQYLQSRPVLCRVMVRALKFPFLQRYPMLVGRNPVADREGAAGYEISLTFNGMPISLVPRAASEFPSKSRVHLISVNEAEHDRAHCGRIVARKGSRWELASRGTDLIALLTY